MKIRNEKRHRRVFSLTLAAVMVMTLVLMSGCNNETPAEPAPDPAPVPEQQTVLAPAAVENLLLTTNIDEEGVVSFSQAEEALGADAAVSDAENNAVSGDSASGDTAVYTPKITAQWNAPAADEGRLPVKGYIVAIDIVHAGITADAAEAEDSATVDNTAAETDDGADAVEAESGAEEDTLTYPIEVKTEELNYTFDDLSFDTEYVVSVQAYSEYTEEEGTVVAEGTVQDGLLIGQETKQTVKTGVPMLESPALKAVAQNQTDIKLSWGTVDGATGYVLRCGAGAETVTDLLYNASGDETEYTNAGLAPGTTVYYSIAAIYGSHEYKVSDIVTATSKSADAPAKSSSGGSSASNSGGGGTSGGGGGGAAPVGHWYYFAQCGAQFATAAEAEYHAACAHDYTDETGYHMVTEHWGGCMASSPGEAWAILKATYGW